MGNKFKLDEVQKKFQQLKKVLPKEIGTEAKNFFQDNFRKQGFEDSSIKSWKPRKHDKGSSVGRRILTKTGRLQGSIRITTATFNKITIGTNVPYAKIHNEGGTINRAASSRDIHFKNFDGFKNVRGKKTVVMGLVMSKKRGSTKTKNVSIPAYKITMPKREFMGRSRNLENKLRKKIDSQIKEVFGNAAKR